MQSIPPTTVNKQTVKIGTAILPLVLSVLQAQVAMAKVSKIQAQDPAAAAPGSGSVLMDGLSGTTVTSAGCSMASLAELQVRVPA